MGNAPIRPTAEQARELEYNFDKLCRQSAEKLNSADLLIVLTGEGYSAESGLPTYHDVSKIDAYEKRKLEYHDICRLSWLEEEPKLFWGFWGSAFNNARTNAPHEGYSILKRWRDEYFGEENDLSLQIRQRLAKKDTNPSCNRKMNAGAFYYFTTNVDAHCYDHFQAYEVRERNGNIEQYQCSKRCSRDVWRAPAEHLFNVDRDTMLAGPGIACEESEQRENLLRYYSPNQEMIQECFETDAVFCPHCKAAARPCVLMFDDNDWFDSKSQLEQWKSWRNAVREEVEDKYDLMGEGGNIVLLEIGTGCHVTTCREESEKLYKYFKSEQANVTLIRINPEFPLADTQECKDMISLFGDGLTALRAIDKQWQNMCA